MQQIPISETLDVEAIERELGVLWKDSAAKQPEELTAVMRARVANLMILTPGESDLDQINATLRELSAVHPCRALVIVAERQQQDRDIQLYISSFYQESAGGKRVSCEEITLIACGRFVAELASATLPLLVPDLPTFLWWTDALEPVDKAFCDFSRACDRLVIDTAGATDSRETLLAVAGIFAEERYKHLNVSDINWARITSWRALLASFYDVQRCKEALQDVTTVTIDYSASEHDALNVAPQALLLGGWLASRLGWQLIDKKEAQGNVQYAYDCEGGRIRLHLNRLYRPDMKPGRLARVKLTTENDQDSFIVSRDEQGTHLRTESIVAGLAHPGRVLPVRNRSSAQLIGREMEILCNDNIYAEAVKMAARMIQFPIDTLAKPSV